MPEFTAVLLAFLAMLFAVGVVLGWFLRSDRCAREKIAINAGWHEQNEARQSENERLEEQNKRLMQQVSESQASHNDASQRARELSGSLKEAVERRDELQRQIKDIRDNLEAAMLQRNRLEADIRTRDVRGEATANTLREKDNKIFKLSRELNSWQSRVPPLVEKYRQRDREANELQGELDRATNRIVELEVLTRADETHIEPSHRSSLVEGLDASNDQYDETSEHDLAGLKDQVVDDVFGPAQGNGISGRYEIKFGANQLDEQVLSGWPPAAAATDAPHSSGIADGPRDNLQQIKGVGPAIENTLNELGIFRFDQIARISEFDIDRIAERLRGFRSRIYREDWIGQARTLQYQKDGGPVL